MIKECLSVSARSWRLHISQSLEDQAPLLLVLPPPPASLPPRLLWTTLTSWSASSRMIIWRTTWTPPSERTTFCRNSQRWSTAEESGVQSKPCTQLLTHKLFLWLFVLKRLYFNFYQILGSYFFMFFTWLVFSLSLPSHESFWWSFSVGLTQITTVHDHFKLIRFFKDKVVKVLWEIRGTSLMWGCWRIGISGEEFICILCMHWGRVSYVEIMNTAACTVTRPHLYVFHVFDLIRQLFPTSWFLKLWLCISLFFKSQLSPWERAESRELFSRVHRSFYI